MSTNLPAKTGVNAGGHGSSDALVGKVGARPLALFIPTATGAASLFDREI